MLLCDPSFQSLHELRYGAICAAGRTTISLTQTSSGNPSMNAIVSATHLAREEW
jgi:hypothetical protein